MEIRNPDYHVDMAQYWRERSVKVHSQLMAQSCLKMMRRHYMAANWARQRELTR
jgi:hypothetical protein